MNSVELSRRFSIDYGRKVRKIDEQLEPLGWYVERKQIENSKIYLYTLKQEDRPEWFVDVEVRLANGDVSVQHVRVRADTEGLARNKAQHKAQRVRILSSEMRPALTK